MLWHCGERRGGLERDKETKVLEEVVSEVEAFKGMEGGGNRGESWNPQAVEGEQGYNSPLQKYPQVRN